MNPFAKTTEQIAADMSINFFSYPKAVSCSRRGCKNQVHIHFEGPNPGICWACQEQDSREKAVRW